MSLNHAGKRPSVAGFINPISVDILIISDIFLPIFKDLLESAFDKQEVRDNSSEQKRSEKSPRRFELRRENRVLNQLLRPRIDRFHLLRVMILDECERTNVKYWRVVFSYSIRFLPAVHNLHTALQHSADLRSRPRSRFRVGKSLIWGSILQHKIQRPGTYVIQMRKKSSELLEKQSLVACKYLAASSLI
ncbi:hypothetical protein ACS0TY_029593 [Phlomoides rotata]